MDHRKKSKEESREIEKRRHESVLKFEKIVDQFDDLADALDPLTQPAKRSKTSHQVTNQNPSGAGGSNSAAAAAAAEAEAAQRSRLTDIIIWHMNDMHRFPPKKP